MTTPSPTNPNPKREDEREAGSNEQTGTPERLIQRLEDATPGLLFYCEADREEALEIAREEMASALASARPSPGDPVRATEGIDWNRLNDLFSQIPSGPWDAFRTGGGHEIRQFDSDPTNKHHWPFRLCQSIAGQRAQCDDAVFDFLAGVLNAWPQIVAPLSVSTPTGEGEEAGGAREEFIRRRDSARVAEQNHLRAGQREVAAYSRGLAWAYDKAISFVPPADPVHSRQEKEQPEEARRLWEIVISGDTKRAFAFVTETVDRLDPTIRGLDCVPTAPTSPPKSSGEEA